MEIFIIKNWSTKEEVRIEAISWSIEQYQHTFYCVDELESSIVQKSYGTRYWDLTDRFKKK
tara:strand:+ start:41 stop:223 length:183 start_codon:yes stop_codon:yes gene_type:complete